MRDMVTADSDGVLKTNLAVGWEQINQASRMS